MPDKKQEKSAVKQEERKAAVIYIGPAIAGVALPGAVYNNGLPPQLKEAAEEIPGLNKLLVDTKNAVQMRRELRYPQSAISICYQRVLDYVMEKGVKA